MYAEKRTVPRGTAAVTDPISAEDTEQRALIGRIASISTSSGAN